MDAAPGVDVSCIMASAVSVAGEAIMASGVSVTCIIIASAVSVADDDIMASGVGAAPVPQAAIVKEKRRVMLIKMVRVFIRFSYGLIKDF
jgi:hypothetical protein